MKKTLTIIFFNLIVISSYAQSCEIYRVKCIGKINPKSFTIQKIRLQSGLEIESTNKNYIEVKINSNEINNMLPGFDYLSGLPQKGTFSVIIDILKNGKTEENRIDLKWNSTQLKELTNIDFTGTLFELNLGELNIK